MFNFLTDRKLAVWQGRCKNNQSDNGYRQIEGCYHTPSCRLHLWLEVCWWCRHVYCQCGRGYPCRLFGMLLFLLQVQFSQLNEYMYWRLAPIVCTLAMRETWPLQRRALFYFPVTVNCLTWDLCDFPVRI